MKKVFIDSEFTGLYQNTELISIGLVTEDDEIFYAEFNDYSTEGIDKWTENKVISNLRFNGKPILIPNIDIKQAKNFSMKGTTMLIRDKLIKWFDRFEEVEIWGDALSWDWVLFCEIFGGAMHIPSQIYYMPFDIGTAFKMKNIDTDINRGEFVKDSPIMKKFNKNSKHNALWDAVMIKECYRKLENF